MSEDSRAAMRDAIERMRRTVEQMRAELDEAAQRDEPRGARARRRAPVSAPVEP